MMILEDHKRLVAAGKNGEIVTCKDGREHLDFIITMYIAV